MAVGSRTKSYTVACLCVAAVGWGVAGSAEKVKLTWWWGVDPGQQQFIEKTLIPNFEAAHPDITIDFVPRTGDKEDKLFAAFLAGTAPDIFGGWPEERAMFPQKKMDIPLDSYLATWDGYDDFFAGAWDSTKYNGHIYGIPYYLDLRTIVYRKDFFADVGLDNKQPPQDWRQLVDAAQKLTIKDAQGKLVRAGINVAPDANNFSPYLWQAGGYFVSEDLSKSTMSEPDALRALRFYQSLVREYGVSPAAGVSDSWGGAFWDGREAMVYANSAVPGRVKSTHPDLYAQTGSGLPPMDKARAAMLHADYLVISATSKHPNEAFEFLKFLFKPENLVALDAIDNLTPPLKSLVHSQYAQENPVMLQMLEAAPYGSAGRILLDTTAFFKYTKEMLTDVLSGAADPATAAAHYDQEMNAALADAIKNGAH